jgi:hypothetical protein
MRSRRAIPLRMSSEQIAPSGPCHRGLPIYISNDWEGLFFRRNQFQIDSGGNIHEEIIGADIQHSAIFRRPTFAQERLESPAQHSVPHANGGRIPPPPTDRTDARPEHEGERVEGGTPNTRRHVNNDHCYGHDRPNDARFHVDHPFEHGRFAHVGPSFRYDVRVDLDAHRFWLPGGFFFEVAAWDWPEAAGWCWNCGDDFAVYEDLDRPGWYLVYNIQTGAYVHATSLGS